MGRRLRYHLHQHCRLLHLDTSTPRASSQQAVSRILSSPIACAPLTVVDCRYVRINEVWDRISKILILLVDAGLNYYFLRTVKQRLVIQHGLTKYAPLVGFNAKLMVVSILMDVSGPVLVKSRQKFKSNHTLSSFSPPGSLNRSHVAPQPSRVHTVSSCGVHGEVEH